MILENQTDDFFFYYHALVTSKFSRYLIQEETVNTLGTTSTEQQKEDLPLLCWFCSQEFESFQSLW